MDFIMINDDLNQPCFDINVASFPFRTTNVHIDTIQA